MTTYGRPYSDRARTIEHLVPANHLDRTADQISGLNNLLSDHWQDIHEVTDQRLRKHVKAAQVALARCSSRLRWLADQERRS